MLVTSIMNHMTRSRQENRSCKLMKDYNAKIPTLYKKIPLLLHAVRSKDSDQEIMDVLKKCSEDQNLAIAVGEVPTDALLLKIIAAFFNNSNDVAKLIFDFVFYRDPVNITNIIWVSNAYLEMSGKNPDGTPRKNYAGDSDYLVHPKMHEYIDKLMEKYEDHPPLDLTSITGSFGRKLDYMMDLDGKGEVYLQVGLVLSFTFERKFCVATISWRLDFDIDIIDIVVDFALNDSVTHFWDLSPFDIKNEGKEL